MRVEVLYFAGCPNCALAMETLQGTLHSFGRSEEIQQVEIRTQAEAEATGFVGSSSIRINGVDFEPWARAAKTFGLSCRTYSHGSQRSGVPSSELLRRAIEESIREGR